MTDRKSQTFEGSHGATIRAALNFPQHRYDDDDAYVRGNHTYISVVGTGSLTFALSEEDTRALRDHLSVLLGDDVSETALTERSIAAMETLAHQMDVFYTDDLTDALNKHSETLRKVHNL